MVSKKYDRAKESQRLYRIAHRDERNAYNREYRRTHPRPGRDLAALFGITLSQYNDMLTAQGGVCAICGKPETVTHNNSSQVRSLAVDHCHSSNKVRGLLCMACNVSIARFNDDPDMLRKAARYLERHQQ